MKKNFKRTLAKVMAVAMTVALVGTAPEADAAKKIKLSKKSITVTKGKTKKVTIKNVKAKKVKKLTVKSSKKKIATVKKAGKTAFKVTGKKKGTAKVTVKVTVKGKKKATKLTLTVKVKNAEKKDTTQTTTAAPVVNNATPTPAVNNATPTPAADATKAPEGTATQTPSGDTTPAPGGDVTSPTPAATPVPVEVDTTDITNVQLGGKNASLITKFAVSETGATECIYNSNAKYGGVYTYFDLVIPEGSTAADIKKISFDISGAEGDIMWKHVHLIAGSVDPDSVDAFPTAEDIAYNYEDNTFGNVTLIGDSEQVKEINGSYDFEITETEATYLDDLMSDGKVRIAMYLNIGGDSAGVTTKYTISNIKVVGTKGVKFSEGFEAAGTTIDNTDAPALVALATNDTAKIEQVNGEWEERTITLDIAKAAADYNLTVKKATLTATPEGVLDIVDNGNGTASVSLKDGYTLPEGKDYVDVAITAEIEFTSGAGMAGGLTIVVGDNSKVDISGQLGKEADEYVLLDLSDAFIREGKEAEITLTPGRKSGVDILTYDISATSNGNLWVGWDFSGIDMTDATEVIFLVKSEGAAAKLASVGAADKSWLSDIGYCDPAADEFTKVTISKDKLTQFMGIKGNSWNGVLDIYAVAVVGGKEITE